MSMTLRIAGVGRATVFVATFPRRFPALPPAYGIGAAIALLSRDRRVPHGRRRRRRLHAGPAECRQQFRSCTPPSSASFLGYLVNVGLRAVQRHTSSGPARSVRRARVRSSPPRRARARRPRLSRGPRYLELWARSRRLVLSCDGKRGGRGAWDVWLTPAFLSEVGLSMKRLRRGVRHRVGDRHPVRPAGRATPPGGRSTPSSSVYERCPRSPSHPRCASFSASATPRASWSSPSACAFPILVNTAEGVRGDSAGIEEHRLAAARPAVGALSRGSTCPPRCPSIMAGLRFAASLGLVLVIVTEFVGEGERHSATTSASSSPHCDYPFAVRGHSLPRPARVRAEPALPCR